MSWTVFSRHDVVHQYILHKTYMGAQRQGRWKPCELQPRWHQWDFTRNY